LAAIRSVRLTGFAFLLSLSSGWLELGTEGCDSVLLLLADSWLLLLLAGLSGISHSLLIVSPTGVPHPWQKVLFLGIFFRHSRHVVRSVICLAVR
jgi:hypothetical protein